MRPTPTNQPHVADSSRQKDLPTNNLVSLFFRKNRLALSSACAKLNGGATIRANMEKSKKTTGAKSGPKQNDVGSKAGQNPKSEHFLLVERVSHLISGNDLQPIPVALVTDDASLRKCLLAISRAAEAKGDEATLLRNSTDILLWAYRIARLSLEQVSSILTQGISYPKIFQFLKVDAPSGNVGMVAPDTRRDDYVHLLACISAIRDGQELPKPAPMYVKTGKTLMLRTRHLVFRDGIAKTPPEDPPPADVYEKRLRNNKALEDQLSEIADGFAINYWIYLLNQHWFVPLDEHRQFFEDVSKKLPHRYELLLLRGVCMENHLAVVAFHPDRHGKGKVLALQAQRVRVGFDSRTNANVAYIPAYYRFSHIEDNKLTDFLDLYGCMSSPSDQRPLRMTEEELVSEAEQFYRQCLAERMTENQAWHATRAHMSWSDDTMIKRLWAEPKL